MSWLYKRGGVWWIGYRTNGKQVLRSTGHADKQEAEKERYRVDALCSAHKAGSLTEELYRALTGATKPTLTLKQALREWLAEAEGSTAPGSFTRYSRIARDFETFTGATDAGPLLSSINADTIRGYLAQRRKEISASSANLERKILSGFINRYVDAGAIPHNPVRQTKLSKASQGEKQARRPFTIEEVRALYAKAPDPFWRYMVLSAFFTGLRMGDLICLRWGAVDLNENVIRITSGKTGTRVAIPLRPVLKTMLSELRLQAADARPGTFIWPEQAKRYEASKSASFSNGFYDNLLVPCGLVAVRPSKHAVKAGRRSTRETNEISFHSLRHSFVSLIKATGGSQAVAKELAGHSSDTVSDNYTTLPPEVLAEAVNRLPDIGLPSPVPTKPADAPKQEVA